MVLLIAVASLVIYSCNKDKDDSDDNTNNTPTPVVNVLCDGNGEVSYYPLDSANS